MSTLADLLPPRIRAAIYGVLGVVHAVILAAEVLYDTPKWFALVLAGVDAAGFTLARANTPTEVE